MSTLRRRLLDDTYKKTASGNPVIARTVARMNPDLKVYGWTEQDTYSGNNLLNFTDTEQIINGMTFHVKKSVLIVTGTTTEFTSTAGEIYYMLPITVGTFYLSMRSSSMEYISNPKLEAWVIDADDTEHFYRNGAFSLNGTEKSCRVYFAIPEGNTFNGDKFYPMINVGSDSLTWEPYTGGKPAPNPDYPIPWHNAGEVMSTAVNPDTRVLEVNITGRNLFDASLFTDEDLAGTLVTNNGDGSFTIADSYTEWTSMNVRKNLSDEMTRTLFRPGTLHINCGQATYPYFEINFYKNDENVISETNLGLAYRDLVLPNSYFEKNNGDEIHVQYVIYSALDGESKFKPGTFRPMIYYDGNGSFEPYKEPQSLPLVLEAPLTKWDRIEQRNGVLGVVRKSAEIVLDGSEDEAFSIYEIPDEGKSFAITLNDSVGGYQTSLCDKYRNVNGAWTSYHKGEYAIYSDHVGVTITTRYFRPPSAEIETIEQWKTWLQSNPLTLLYETNEEILEPFDDSQQEILNAIHTYNPSTSVFNWQNCDMDFTYKTRKSVENYE